jgi:hypothetical protein
LLTSLTVAPLLPSLPLGVTQIFTAQGSFSDGTTPDLLADVIWSSSDETVATISNDLVSKSKGKATALKVGTTIISAQFGTFPPASTTLTVTEASLSTIAITPANSSLLSLSTRPFSATGTYSDASTRDVTSEVTWEASAPVVATVATGGIVKALSPGLSTIKATSGTVSGTSNLTVTGGSLNSIALNFAPANNNVLIMGTRSRVMAHGTFSNGTSRDITGAIENWSVVDNTKASVIDDVGNLAWVQALAVTSPEIPAKISASYGSVVLPGESLLTVIDPALNVNGLSIPEQALNLSNGTSGRLSLIGLFSSGNSQDLTLSAEWSSATPATAIVGNGGLDKGRVTALAAGTSLITATYGSQTATATVTVAARTLDTLTISRLSPPAAIIAGTELKYTVTAHYLDGITQDVTADVAWSIDNSNVAKFSDQLSDPGLIVAVDAGTATLTVTFGGKIVTEGIAVSP